MAIDPETLPTSLLPLHRAKDPAAMAHNPVADPLWGLLRQVHFGELAAEDIGSPALVRIEAESNTFTAIETEVAGLRRPYDPQIAPIEAEIARDEGTRSGDCHIDRIRMGQDVAAIFHGAGASDAVLERLHDRFRLPPFGRAATGSDDHLALYAGRALDGFAIRDQFRNAPPIFFVESMDPDGTIDDPDELAESLLDWAADRPEGAPEPAWRDADMRFERRLYAPVGHASPLPAATVAASQSIVTETLPSHLATLGSEDVTALLRSDHAASDAALKLRGANVSQGLTAQGFWIDAYSGGGVDWWNLTFEDTHFGSEFGRPAPPYVATILPSLVPLSGAPESRLWTVEPHDTDYADLDPAPEDLARLVVAEFALGGADGWFLAPFDVAAGSVTQFKRLMIRDVFGRDTNLKLHHPSDHDPFAFGHVSGLMDTLVVMPTTGLLQSGQPIETVHIARDEGANLVWAVEDRVADPDTGLSLDQAEVALRSLPPEPGPRAPSSAELGYTIRSDVPANWFPYQMSVDQGRQLNRATFSVGRGGPQRDPLGSILNGALPIRDEALPPTGAKLERQPYRVRWSGSVSTWTGRRRAAERPKPAHSGLRYDMTGPVPGGPSDPLDATRYSLRDIASYAGSPPSLDALRRAEGAAFDGSLRSLIEAMAAKRDP